MPPIRLIATDFDGTIFRTDGENDPVAYAEFRRRLLDLRRRHGTRWAVITGRHRAALPTISAELLMHGLAADFLVMEDARIYRRRGSWYVPFLLWNWGLTWRRRRQLGRHRPRVRRLAEETRARFPGAQDMAHRHLIDYWFKFEAEGQAQEMEAELRREYGASREFFVFRWGSELCLAPTAGSKGEALTKLAGRLSVAREAIFAVGDGQNDLSMLDASRCGMPACVANAAPEVLAAVAASGGYVAQGAVMAGTAEALGHYC